MNRTNPLEVILDILFPPRCVFCRRILKTHESGICAECQEKLPWIAGREAEQKLEFVSCCVSPLWYQNTVRESVLRYKFHDRSGYAKTYGRLVAQCVTDHLAGKFDLITWVPLSSKGLKKRGYDQAMLLAMASALELDHVAVETLQKVRHTDMQSGLKDDSARRANVLGAYQVLDADLIADKRILLIDDVVTTGSTLSECARTLCSCGAKEIFCATLARARGEKTANRH